MREDIIIQGATVGYLEKDSMQAFLTSEAPDAVIEELISNGYAVCIS